MRVARFAVVGPAAMHGLCFAWLLAVVCAVMAAWTSSDARVLEALDYRREAIAAGEAWRLVTAHLVHLAVSHAVVDLAGLLLVAWIFGAELGPWRPIVACATGAAAIDLGLWFGHPEVARYAGLSGLLHAWFAAGATGWAFASHAIGEAPGLARGKRRWGWLLWAGLAGKLLVEVRAHAFWLDGAGYPVVTAAHRDGAFAGLCCGLAFVALRRAGRARAGAASRVR